MKLKYIILLAIVAIAYIAYICKQKEKAAAIETKKIQNGFKYGELEIPKNGFKYGELEIPKKTTKNGIYKDDLFYTYERSYIEKM